MAKAIDSLSKADVFKGRIDLFGNGAVIDIKTTKNAEPRKFLSDSIDLGYHIQLYLYCILTNSTMPYAIAIETDTCEVACYDIKDVVFHNKTKRDFDKALTTAREVLKMSECPRKFKSEIMAIQAPKWFYEELIYG